MDSQQHYYNKYRSGQETVDLVLAAAAVSRELEAGLERHTREKYCTNPFRECKCMFSGNGVVLVEDDIELPKEAWYFLACFTMFVCYVVMCCSTCFCFALMGPEPKERSDRYNSNRYDSRDSSFDPTTCWPVSVGALVVLVVLVVFEPFARTHYNTQSNQCQLTVWSEWGPCTTAAAPLAPASPIAPANLDSANGHGAEDTRPPAEDTQSPEVLAPTLWATASRHIIVPIDDTATMNSECTAKLTRRRRCPADADVAPLPCPFSDDASFLQLISDHPRFADLWNTAKATPPRCIETARALRALVRVFHPDRVRKTVPPDCAKLDIQTIADNALGTITAMVNKRCHNRVVDHDEEL
jgi:hypothetical protein